MKTTLSLISLLIILSCNSVKEFRWKPQGEITTIRIDDDSEYHFSTDYNIENDISKYNIQIVRKDTIPSVFIKQIRCKSGICNGSDQDWRDDQPESYKIIIPNNFKIETFDD